jgi:NADH dehydrogenase
MGRFAGRTIAAEASAGPGDAAPRKTFVYRDRGSMAIIGKSKAVAQFPRFRLGGFPAWLLWGGVHIASLIGFRNRVQVLLSWFLNWLFNARDARLITGDSRTDVKVPLSTVGRADVESPDERPRDEKRRIHSRNDF